MRETDTDTSPRRQLIHVRISVEVHEALVAFQRRTRRQQSGAVDVLLEQALREEGFLPPLQAADLKAA